MELPNITVVGAGVAGLFLAYELTTICGQGSTISLIDMGKNATDRDGIETFGVGGAGGFFDGKQHYTATLSHRKCAHLIDSAIYDQQLTRVEEIFTSFGASTIFYPQDKAAAQALALAAHEKGVTIHLRRIRHLGSDQSSAITRRMEQFLIDRGVRFITKTRVIDLHIEDNTIKGVVIESGEVLPSDYVVLAPGRIGSAWLRDIASRHVLEAESDAIEIGGRVEFATEVLEHHVTTLYDPIFSLQTPTFNDTIRTFCCCPHGQVMAEQHSGYVTVNGGSKSDYRSANSNFAFLVELKPDDVGGDTTAYAVALAKFITVAGKGKPILQRLEDFWCGREGQLDQLLRGQVQPSLAEVTCMDITTLLPYRFVVDLQEGLRALESVLPGICAGDNLLYIPEIKTRASRIIVDSDWQTSLRNLFVAGDGAGLSGSITGAAANGLIVAHRLSQRIS